MAGYVLSAPSRIELIEIQDYITERDSSRAADKVIDAFARAFEMIATMPGIGHKHKYIADPSLRVWCVHHWLIVYRPGPRPIEIAHIISGRRDIARLL